MLNEAKLGTIERLAKGRVDCLTIIWIDKLQKPFMGWSEGGRVLLKNTKCFWRPLHLKCIQVCFPTTHFGDGLGDKQSFALFFNFQNKFGFRTPGNVLPLLCRRKPTSYDQDENK